MGGSGLSLDTSDIQIHSQQCHVENITLFSGELKCHAATCYILMNMVLKSLSFYFNSYVLLSLIYNNFTVNFNILYFF